jgi:CPA1 family monovalent cation:H+ antiporter
VARDGASEHHAEHEAELAARRDALATALQSLEAMTDDPKMSEEVLRLLRARHETRSSQLPDSPAAHETTALGVELTRDLIGIERKCIHTLLRNGRLTDEARRRIERDLDLEEAGLANREYRKIPL